MEKVGCSLRAQTEANRFTISLDLVKVSSDSTTDPYPTLNLCLLPWEATEENSTRVNLLFLPSTEAVPTCYLHQQSPEKAIRGYKAAQHQPTSINFPSPGGKSPSVPFLEAWIICN